MPTADKKWALVVNDKREIWRPVPGADGYLVSTAGRLLNNSTGRIIGWRGSGGYMHANVNGADVYVHRLVALPFHGPQKPGEEVE